MTHTAENDAPFNAMFDAIDRAEADALTLHQRGECHLSEWSCSHCGETRSSARSGVFAPGKRFEPRPIPPEETQP